MSRIGFIGTGHIAAPMVRFLERRSHHITVSQRNAQVAAQLRSECGVEIAENQAVVDGSDIVFLCVRPHLAQEVLSALDFRPDHQIVSVMAGVSLEELRGLCAPASDITITIPLGFLENGGCPLPACPHDTVLKPLFEPENPVFEVSNEAAFNQHFAVCALVPGLLDLMASTASWLTAHTGEGAQAEVYTHQLVSGFLSSVSTENSGFLMRERDALATDGTISLMMTRGLKETGAHEALCNTLDLIGARLGGKT